MKAGSTSKSPRGRPASPTEGATEAVASIRSLIAANGWSEARLARKAGASQSAVHRTLHDPSPKWTPTLRQLMHYVENPELTPKKPIEAQLPAPLLKAARALWDGTSTDAERITKLLTLVRDLRTSK